MFCKKKWKFLLREKERKKKDGERIGIKIRAWGFFLKTKMPKTKLQAVNVVTV